MSSYSNLQQKNKNLQASCTALSAAVGEKNKRIAELEAEIKTTHTDAIMKLKGQAADNNNRALFWEAESGMWKTRHENGALALNELKKHADNLLNEHAKLRKQIDALLNYADAKNSSFEAMRDLLNAINRERVSESNMRAAGFEVNHIIN